MATYQKMNMVIFPAEFQQRTAPIQTKILSYAPHSPQHRRSQTRMPVLRRKDKMVLQLKYRMTTGFKHY